MSALIPPDALCGMIGQPGIRLVDATYPSNPAFFAQARIGNAVLFDIDAVADQTTPLPHMLPDAEGFSHAVGTMGIGNDDTVIVYDRSGMAMAAARVWWMFRTFGHQRVMVLNGGLPAWIKADYALVSGTYTPPTPKTYTAHLNPALARSATQVVESIGSPDTLIIDARPQERFLGLMPEPRPGMRAGHIPGSMNIPFSALIDPSTGMLNTNHPQVLEAVRTAPANIVTSCGSGVTACLLALALHEAGRADTAVYDGSWAEWGNDSLGMPIEQ
jgi:thiosulfate/3-mercaptopyruvate sulfurtransferase